MTFPVPTKAFIAPESSGKGAFLMKFPQAYRLKSSQGSMDVSLLASIHLDRSRHFAVWQYPAPEINYVYLEF